MEEVILVNENDESLGTCEKLEAHQKALLHRAFSVFVFNSKGELLLQKRALEKYHSGGLWTNTCCGHPRPGEDIRRAAERRLKEEMGFACELKGKFQFTYKARLNNELSEHELDHVFFGSYESDPHPDPCEASGWKWISLGGLEKELHDHPESFTAWLKICFDRVKAARGH
ncbi:MAG TPA: isopentenyl-diphosphate Delta-isomerase [Bacteroidia bacterium]|jgi:isopentenyl-diphosphate delta-isomerase